jgi:hypothetical protein
MGQINNSELMKQGMYQDSQGRIQDLKQDNFTRNFGNTMDTLDRTGGAIGNTVGNLGKTLLEGVKTVGKKIGGFFGKLFSGKNPFK